jgi:hypothetical protein
MKFSNPTNIWKQLRKLRSFSLSNPLKAGAFNKRTYVNTTIDDVVRALELDRGEIQTKRQSLIDDIADFVRAAMNGEKREKLVNSEGRPFLGIPLFQELKANPRDILRGLYLGGLRDNPDIRKEAERLTQTKIGGGRCYLIDVEKMLGMNLDGEKLAHEAHEGDLEAYEKAGLILNTEGVVDPRSQRYFYIRHRLGPGQSDDAAFVMAGILYNKDVALGVFLADAIDTLEKYAPYCSDQDGALSFQISRGFKELGMKLEDVYELASLAAIPEAEEETVPDSSLRYLLSIDSRAGQCAFRTHLEFIEGKPIVPLPVSFKKILSTQFYEYINRRLINVSKLQKLAMPNLTIKEIDRSITDAVKKDFAVMTKDATLADAVRKFKETKCEIIVVQDKNNKVVGTLAPADLMRLLDGGTNKNA